MATTALKKVGIEVAVAGSTDEEAAASAAEAAEAGGEGAAEALGAAAEAVTPDALSEIWEQERQAWSVLLDGSGLSEHMEVGGCVGKQGGQMKLASCLCVGCDKNTLMGWDLLSCFLNSSISLQPLYLENLQKYLETMAAEGESAQQEQQQGQQGGEGTQGSRRQEAAADRPAASPEPS